MLAATGGLTAGAAHAQLYAKPIAPLYAAYDRVHIAWSAPSGGNCSNSAAKKNRPVFSQEAVISHALFIATAITTSMDKILPA